MWDLYYEAKTPYAWHQDAFNLAKKIAELDLDHLSPIEALQELYELQLMSNRSLKSSQHD